MHTPHAPLRRLGAAAVGGLLAVGLLAGLPTAATAVPGDPDAVASGADWTITRVAGGYQVTKRLDDPLPVVSDLPVLEVDGVAVGLATESADGRSLTAVTGDLPDGDLAGAEQVGVGWSTGTDKATPGNAPVAAAQEAEAPVKPLSKARLRALAAEARAAGTPTDDGSTPGPYAYVEDDYDFGDQAVDLANIGGVRGELTGRIYLPTTGGERPTVVLLHGRHSYCTVPAGGGTVSNPDRWPCIAPQVDIPSYKGYEALGQTLATHGYAVVSISANAINANDNQLAPDYGAQARGRLVLDTLAMLEKANAGRPVSFHDAARDVTVTLDEALAVDTAAADLGIEPTSGTNPGQPITAASLVGRFDLDNVGLMGHSRGGEGVVSAVNLNQAAARPYGIRSVLPLAPVDFGRSTAVDTDMLVILPYCDGDVSNQQGQHFSDDSRYAFADDALRSTLWVTGANHNFFNTVWTPGLYPLSVSDDWRASADAVCGADAETSLRLLPEEQYDLGVATMSAWFRLTMGGEESFLPMFDGSADPTLASVPDADLWATATAPASHRVDIETFTAKSSRVRVFGSASAVTCASAAFRTTPQDLAPCATAGALRSTSAMPHWTPASFAPNAPASPMLKLLWSSVSGNTAASVRVTVPAAARDARGYDALTFKTAPDESVATGTDLTVTVVDGAGATWSAPVSELNPGAVTRLPSSDSTTLNKIVLQQVSIPVATLAETVDVSDLREVRIAGATGADGTAEGGVYLSDLNLSRSATGTQAGLASAPTVEVAATAIEEGDGLGEASAAAILTRPVDHEVTAWFSLIGSNSLTGLGKVAHAVQEVRFAPGETCVPVTFTTYGDAAPGAAASTPYKMDVSVPTGAIVGAGQFAWLSVREDDGVTDGDPAPEVGAQGDVCAEYAARGGRAPLRLSDATPAPGEVVTVTATGFRAGERVTLADGEVELGSVLADPAGTARFTWRLAADAALGRHELRATGAGSQRTAVAQARVLAPARISIKAPAKARAGQARKVTVKVTGVAGAARPTGTVTLRLGAGKVAKVALPASGTVVRSVKVTGAGNRKLVVRYSGDTRYAASSATKAVKVLKARRR